MKNIFVCLVIVAAAISGCSEDGVDRPVLDLAEGDVVAPSLMNEIDGVDPLTFTEENLADTFETFEWDPVEFDIAVAVNYTMELSSVEDFSDTPTQIFTTRLTTFAVTITSLNDFLIAAGFEANAEVDFFLRIKAEAANTVIPAQYSEVLTRTVTTFAAIPDPLYFVGPGTAAGWDNAGTFGSLFPDEANPRLYYYTGRFSGEWKIITAQGSWDQQWGKANGEAIANSGNAIDKVSNGGGDPDTWNFPEGDRYYSFTLNTSTNTYTYETYDESGDSEYSAVGLIGAAIGGWGDGDELDMTQSTFDPHIWNRNDVVFAADGFKIRPDDDWGNAWGSQGAEGANGWPAFVAKQDCCGANLVSKAGTYDVWFNDITGRFFAIASD